MRFDRALHDAFDQATHVFDAPVRPRLLGSIVIIGDLTNRAGCLRPRRRRLRTAQGRTCREGIHPDDFQCDLSDVRPQVRR